MKNLSDTVRAGLLSGYLIPRLFVKGDFASGTYGFWNDAGDVNVGGVVYEGSRSLVSVSQAGGGVSDLSIPGLTVTLSGISAEAFGTFFAEVWHQRPMALDIGFLDPDSRNLLDTPDRAFSGYMDTATRKGGARKKATLEIACEDASLRSTRAFADVRSDANQRDRLSTDTLFQRLTSARGAVVYWNQPTPQVAAKNGFNLT